MLYEDPYLTVELDDGERIVRYKRSATPWPSLTMLQESHARFRRGELLPLARGRFALLIDVREAPPRNDPAFEAEIRLNISAISERFVARATLVKSAVGRLQVQRLQSSPHGVFHDEADALAYLRKALVA